MIPRLNYDADSFKDIQQYFTTRALQLAPLGYVWQKDFILSEHGVATHFTLGNRRFVSGYTPLYLRGQGHAKKLLLEDGHEVLTIADCHIESFLEAQQIAYRSEDGVFDSAEYMMIQEFYGDQRAARSGVLKMNHIDEGIYIMTKLGASEKAMRAFCLHPLLQEDGDLKQQFDYVAACADTIPVALAMEYRSYANAWLSERVTKSYGLFSGFDYDQMPKLSPLQDVNCMLVADKIQNYKDFLKYHNGRNGGNRHARALELDEYFTVWLEALNVSMDQLNQFFNELEAITL